MTVHVYERRVTAAHVHERSPVKPTTYLADALVSVPRHLFIPAQAWATPSGSRAGYWIDREADPATWWHAVCSDTVIYTQLDDGRTELTAENAALTFAPTCSASSPLLINAFLRHLSPQPGNRVLEIGTGTGWTAALLSYLTGGSEHVTTIEIDADLSATAAANLRAVGFSPHLVTGEGEAGFPESAPFDRVHVTCGVRDIPYAWIEQTRPGGVIVLPYNPPVGRLLYLTVKGDGSAVGRFGTDCSFMLLRSQRDDSGRPDTETVDTEPRRRSVDVDPELLLHPGPGLQVLFAAIVGDDPWRTPKGAVVLSDDVSHATVENGQVTQTGPRDLWTEAEHIYRGWTELGRPGLDRLGLTITPDRQYVWLDDPAVPAAHMLAAQEEQGRG